MHLVIDNEITVLSQNDADYIKHVGFNSISVDDEIDTADELILAVDKILNPFVNDLEGDYKDFKESNFHFYYSIFSTISDVEIIEEVENKSITFKFKGTEGTFLV